jgi:hypothetical protein|tara:strand:- start:155 stop:352 length:198 start_codon:yes stop_codon:yes gene_type:complete
MEELNSCDDSSKLTLLLNIKQGTQSTTYSVSNLPDWYDMLGIFALYGIVAILIFYIGLWIGSRYI